MKPIGTHNYFTYIMTNKNRTVLYIGVTNNLKKRLIQHEEVAKINDSNKFTSKYNIHYLVYFERFQFIEEAIKREKELKKWNRTKKEKLINTSNPNWDFLNDTV